MYPHARIASSPRDHAPLRAMLAVIGEVAVLQFGEDGIGEFAMAAADSANLGSFPFISRQLVVAVRRGRTVLSNALFARDPALPNGCLAHTKVGLLDMNTGATGAPAMQSLPLHQQSGLTKRKRG